MEYGRDCKSDCSHLNFVPIPAFALDKIISFHLNPFDHNLPYCKAEPVALALANAQSG
jgi:hypothetical protein